MSKTVSSVNLLYSDGTNMSGVHDPGVLKAAQAYSDSLSPKPPAPLDPNTIPANAHDANYSIPAGTFRFDPKTFIGSNVSIQGAPLDAHGNPTTILKLSGTGTRWAFNLSPAAQNWKFANLTIDCDPKGGFLQPLYGDKCNIMAQNIRCMNGCLYGGHGGGQVTLINCWSDGIPDQYVVDNFDQPLTYFHWDNSSVDHPIKQGANQAACRYMQVTYGHIIGVHLVGSNFKQALQVRSGGQIIHENCIVECKTGGDWCADNGPMAWQDYSKPENIPDPLLLARFVNCTLSDTPSIQRPGNRDTVKEVDYVNCKIAGKLVNKTINAASWPPKTTP